MKRIISGAAILTSPMVPRYDSTAIEKPTGFNAPRAQGLGPEAFGGGVATNLQQSSNVMGQVAKEEIAKADRTATIESRTALDQAEVDLLYDPKNGALAKRGKDAFSLEEPTLKAYDERIAAMEGNLPRQAQKDAFRLLAGQRRVEIDKQIQRHVYGETKTYADEANKASLESTLNNVSTHYKDPERLEQERKFGLGVIMSDTDNKGKPPEYVKLRIDSWNSKVHEAVIDKMMVDNPIGAQQYFAANKDSILATEAGKIEKTLKPLVSKQSGMDTALELAPQLGSKPLTEVLGVVRERHKSDPDALNFAETQLKQMEAERRDQIKQQQTDAAKPIYQKIAEIQLSGRAAKLSDIPPDQWANLTKLHPEEANKIQDSLRREVQGEEDRKERKLDRLERKAEREERERERRENKSTPENLTTWGLLKTNPATLGQTNLDELFTHKKINKTQYQDLITDQLAIKQGKGEHEAKILSDKAAVDLVLSAVKIDSKKQPEQYFKFQEALNTKMKVFEAENGHKPKQADVVNLSRGLLAEVSQDVNFWPIDKTVHVFEANIDKVRVPPADRAAITKALQFNNLPVSEDAIRRQYLEKQTRTAGGKK